MGATNCPETPRQRMISMMYLVLTALLALNVSKEVLEAFVTVNETMEVTNENFTKKMDNSYQGFLTAYNAAKEKVGPYYQKAMIVQKSSKELIDYINNLKAELIAKVQGISVEEAKKFPLKEIDRKDNYDDPTVFFIGDSQDGSAGKSLELKNKINDYRKKMLEMIDVKYRDHFNKSLGLKTDISYTDADGKSQNWEMHHFYHTIMAATITILNKMVAEVKNVEFDVVSQLFSAVRAEDFSFDKIVAKVVPKTNYVLVGDDYEADIFVAALDTKENPEVIVGSSVDTTTNKISGTTRVVPASQGVGKLKIPAGAEGEQKFGGLINIKTPSGGLKSYPFQSEYIVGRPSATVSAEKMNVFYVGLENPVSISVPGVPFEKIKASMTNGTLTPKGKGKYIAKVSSPGQKAIITVSADMGGKIAPMGKNEFRCKRVPDPIAMVGGLKEGIISKEKLKAAGAIIPAMPPDFEFEMFFTVTSYSFTIIKGNEVLEKTVKGNRFTPEVISAINNAGKGQRITFEYIKAQGPDGSHSLQPVNLKLN